MTIKEREKIVEESEVSEEKAKKLADERKKIAAKVGMISCLFVLVFFFLIELVILFSDWHYYSVI